MQRLQPSGPITDAATYFPSGRDLIGGFNGTGERKAAPAFDRKCCHAVNYNESLPTNWV